MVNNFYSLCTAGTATCKLIICNKMHPTYWEQIPLSSGFFKDFLVGYGFSRDQFKWFWVGMRWPIWYWLRYASIMASLWQSPALFKKAEFHVTRCLLWHDIRSSPANKSVLWIIIPSIRRHTPKELNNLHNMPQDVWEQSCGSAKRVWKIRVFREKKRTREMPWFV